MIRYIMKKKIITFKVYTHIIL